jgi:hypothetical protein
MQSGRLLLWLVGDEVKLPPRLLATVLDEEEEIALASAPGEDYIPRRGQPQAVLHTDQPLVTIAVIHYNG